VGGYGGGFGTGERYGYVKKTTTDWISLAKYDIDTVEAMLSAQRYIYVLFCCQQAIEKVLKAYIAEQGDEAPPLIHNLVRLRQLAFPSGGLTCDDDFLRELSAYYIHSRYLAEMIYLTDVSKEINVGFVATKTRELFQWLIEALS